MTPLLATKLFIPALRQDVVPRSRLVAQLERARGCPLTLVSAPAGFGKTTLVSSWVGTYGVRAAWVSLDEGDNDPVRFWLYWISALQQLIPNIGQEVYMLLHTTQDPQWEMIVTLLLNEIAGLSEHMVMILDDYHVIESHEIHKGVGFLLDHLPEQLRLVMATRGDPPFPLARMRARGQLAEIRIADLAFTQDEASILFNEKLGLAICKDDLTALETRTEGWAAGLQLAALALQGKENIHPFIQAFTGNHTYIVDYLLEDVLSDQPDDVQTFLLETSILPRLSGPLCDEITGRTDGAAMLERLRQANLFVLALDDERRWYRYHQLFAEVLRHRLLTEYGQEKVRTLHIRASHWFEQAGLVDEAIQQASSAGDPGRAARLIEDYYETWKKRGELVTALTWLERLPVETLKMNWRLSVVYADILTRVNKLDAAEHWLDEAEKMTAMPGAAQYGEFLAVRAFIFLRQNQLDGASFFAQRALELLPDDQVALRAQVKLVLGVVYYWHDHHEPAMGEFAEVARLALQAEDWNLALNALSNHGLLFSLRGELHKGAEAYRHALQLAADHKMDHIPITHMLYGNLADLACEWADWEAYHAYQTEAVQRAEMGMNPVMQIVNMGREVKIQIVSGNFKDVAHTLENAWKWVEEKKIGQTEWLDFEHFQVRLWLAQGQLSEAVRWVETSGVGIDDSLNSVNEPRYIALARVYLAQGQPERAIFLLQRLLAAAQQAGRVWIQIELRALLGLALHANGQEKEALLFLIETLASAEPQGYVFSFLVAGSALCSLLRKLLESQLPAVLERPHLIAYVHRLLAAFGVSASENVSAPRVPAVQLLEPLSDREQEILQSIDTGLSNREIADKLYISVSTVKTHINNLYGKLGASSRTQALAIARKLGLVIN